MTNEDFIEELLFEAEKLRIREEVINTMVRILDLNPKMEKADAVKLALDNVKLHAGLNNRR